MSPQGQQQHTTSHSVQVPPTTSSGRSIFEQKVEMTSMNLAMAKEKEDLESQEFEIDGDKAIKASKSLTSSFQSLFTKQASSPKLRASDVKYEEAERVKSSVNMRAKEFEISDSFLGYTAVILVLFTIFYNFLFYTIIAPFIDGAP